MLLAESVKVFVNGINGTENAAQRVTGAVTENNYNASRTSTTTGTTNNTLLNIGATAWGWLIISILGIITVALVWYYGKQNEVKVHHTDDNY